jgi:hypothetical protein
LRFAAWALLFVFCPGRRLRFCASRRERWPLSFALAGGYDFAPRGASVGLYLLPWQAATFLRLAAQALPLCGAAPTFLCRGKEK